MIIQHQFQPTGSNLCGQTCVAMLAGISLQEAIKKGYNGHKGRTSLNRSTKKALENLNFKVGDYVRITKHTKLPDLCLIKMRYKQQVGSHFSHLVIYNLRMIYDPISGVFSLEDFLNKFLGAKLNSYLVVEKTP